MAEVLAAFSAIASFFQLVDFTAKVVSTAREPMNSGTDALRETIDTAHLAREYERLAATIDHTPLGATDSIHRLANEYREDLRRLLAQLDQLRLDTRGSKARRALQSTQTVIRTMRRCKDIEKARRRLHELNGLLSTALLKDIWIQNQPLAASHMADPFLRSSGVTNVHQVRVILARKSIANLLDNLRYTGMTARYESVEPAWHNTYEWTLQDETLGFRTWLQAGSGVYWITGKAGSGKSTLMKHLCDAQEAIRLLADWAGARELVSAKFFFWYAGTRAQKSIEGLLRSLLFQLLYAVPSLSRVAFPSAPKSSWSNSGEWTCALLTTALKNIAQDGVLASAESQKSFCFFIDGLDEYQGNHSELAKLILDLATNPYVKICASSRPWNAFRSAFEHRVPNLRLEELSRPDIKRYALERISEASKVHQSDDGSACEKTTALIDEILIKAEGVFLWVVLAVRSVCDGIAEGDDLQFLYWRVMSFPSDLEDFFRAILERADPAYRHQTYQALALACYQAEATFQSATHDNARSEPNDILFFGRDPCIAPSASHSSQLTATAAGSNAESMSFVDFWLIRRSPQGLLDPEFAYTLESRLVKAEDSMQMAEHTSTFLSAACKDLLYLPRFRNDGAKRAYDNADRVEFLHRTVFTFLCTPEMQKVSACGVPEHFRDGRVWHLLNLARRKIQFDTDHQDALLDNALHGSLTVPHVDLCNRYIHAFQDLILDRISRNCRADGYKHLTWYPQIEIVAAYVAFKEYKLLNKIAEDSNWLAYHQQTSGNSLQELWTAALGESRLSCFPIHELQRDVMQTLFSLTAAERDMKKTDSSASSLEGTMTVVKCDLLHCYQNPWQLFLRKWAFAKPPFLSDCQCIAIKKKGHYDHHSADCSRSLRWKGIWQLAAMFLESGAHVNDQFCDAGESVMDSLHLHRHLSAAEFMRQHVPREWYRDAFGERTIRVWEDESFSDTILMDMLAQDDAADFWACAKA